MKRGLKKIELKALICLLVICTMAVFIETHSLVLIITASLFGISILSDYREYQESEEFVSSLYK